MFYNETMKLQARAARYLGGLGVIFMFSCIFQSILNTRLCKILLFVQFLFVQAPWENFGFFQNINDFSVKNVVLGAATYGAQEVSKKKIKNWENPVCRQGQNEIYT